MMNSGIKLEVVGIEKKTGALEEINEGPEFESSGCTIVDNDMSTDEGYDANFNRRDNGGEDKAEGESDRIIEELENDIYDDFEESQDIYDKAEEESDRKIEELENYIYDDFEESQDIYAYNCLVMLSKDW